MVVAYVTLALLAWIWVGYPIAIAGLATLRRRTSMRWPGELPRVSVVIATRDDATSVQRRVDDVLAGDYPAARLDVVVSIDPNLAPEVVPFTPRPDQRVQAVRGAAPGGKAATMNAGVTAAKGEVLVLTDTAQRFAPDAITQLVHAMATPRVGAVSGRLVIDSGDRRRSLSEMYWSLERWLRSNEARLHSTVGVTGAIYAMRRELFVPFPPGLILDDLYAPMQLVLRGFRIGYCDGAVAHEPRRFAIRDERRRKVRTLTGVIQLCVLLPDVLTPWANPIWAQFLCHKLLRFFSPLLVTATVLGAAVEGWRVMRASSVPVLEVTAVSLIVLVVLLAVVGRLRAALVEFVQLNAAIVEAAANGVRGRWDVW